MARSEWRGAGETDVQRAHGLTSCSEWTGVRLATLLKECGAQPGGTWMLAEGADACKLARSVPIAKAMDDALVAYAQNGEPLRPEQGYPLRLLLPGLGRQHQREVAAPAQGDRPAGDDALGDVEVHRPDARRHGAAVHVRDGREVGDHAAVRRRRRSHGAGVYEITGLAWSGRGPIARVDVTTDGGATWTRADLQKPVLPRAHTRFRWTWKWDGTPALLASRAVDDTGYEQPPLADARRGAAASTPTTTTTRFRCGRSRADGKIANGNS